MDLFVTCQDRYVSQWYYAKCEYATYDSMDNTFALLSSLTIVECRAHDQVPPALELITKGIHNFLNSKYSFWFKKLIDTKFKETITILKLTHKY